MNPHGPIKVETENNGHTLEDIGDFETVMLNVDCKKSYYESV